MINRINVGASAHPNFMGCWVFEDKFVCDELIQFFEENKESQRVGRTSLRSVDENVKRSTDIPIAPLDLKDDKFQVFGTFVEHLQCFYLDYLEQWELLKKFYPRLHIGPFNLPRYDAGGHFGAVHSDQ